MYKRQEESVHKKRKLKGLQTHKNNARIMQANYNEPTFQRRIGREWTEWRGSVGEDGGPAPPHVPGVGSIAATVCSAI